MTASMRLFLEREIELERQMDYMLKLIDLAFGETTALELEQQLQRVVGLWRACLVLRDRMVYGPAKLGSDRSRALMADAASNGWTFWPMRLRILPAHGRRRH